MKFFLEDEDDDEEKKPLAAQRLSEEDESSPSTTRTDRSPPSRGETLPQKTKGESIPIIPQLAQDKDYNSMTVVKLRENLNEKGLAESGTKPELVKRLEEATKKDKDYNSMTVVKLRENLNEKGLAESGTKPELVKRLEEAAKKDYSSMTVVKLRNTANERGVPADGTKPELARRLEQADRLAKVEEKEAIQMAKIKEQPPSPVSAISSPVSAKSFPDKATDKEVMAAASAGASASGKTMQISGHIHPYPEINGTYDRSKSETYNGKPIFRLRRGNAVMVWKDGTEDAGRWQVALSWGGNASVVEPVAFAMAPPATAEKKGSALPCEVEPTWHIIGTRGKETIDEGMSCCFLGQVVVVSGRSGNNQRVNGLYAQQLDTFCDAPYFCDKQKHLFLYRQMERGGAGKWCIGNRLGAGIKGGGSDRKGRGILFADNSEDAAAPYACKNHWKVYASTIGDGQELEDPKLTVYLRTEVGYSETGGLAAPLLIIRSEEFPDAVGSYALKDKNMHFGKEAVWVRTSEDEEQLFLFFANNRWCIAKQLTASPRTCIVMSQKRTASTTHECRPDMCIWEDIEVLRGDNSERIPSSLLASLRGNISRMSAQFH